MNNQPNIPNQSPTNVPWPVNNQNMPQQSQSDDLRKQKHSGILLVIWLITALVFSFIWLILPFIFGNITSDYYFTTGYQVTTLALSIIQSLCLLLIPFAITNKTLKITGFILAIILIGYRTVHSIYFFIQSLQHASSL